MGAEIWEFLPAKHTAGQVIIKYILEEFAVSPPVMCGGLSHEKHKIIIMEFL